ncbi:hypothetical protein F5Y16DRAFT_403486 [Xylariaceae sp. FL0255]|nr:hypothetical protein F5Y16DRAFT_403486 [Xylariaceae sp. FL0255]
MLRWHIAISTGDGSEQWQQIFWYDSGVGTTSGWLGKKYEGALGAGLEGNVIEAYNFVSLNWSPGDQVLCFGFSRSAYTARTIAGLVSDIEVCEPRQLQYFPEIWKLIKEDKSGERFYGSYKNMNFARDQHPHGEWATTAESREIEVVGVYDTVGALGIPSVLGFEIGLPFGPDKKGFHNVQLNRTLDDHREASTPTFWSLADTKQPTPEDIANQQQAVADAQQAWYPIAYDKKTPKSKRDELKIWSPGVHINIGDGSSDMLKAKGYLEELRKYQELMEKQEKERAAESYWAWTRRSAANAFSSAKNSVMHPITEVKQPNTLRSDYGWGTGTIIDLNTLMYKANGSKARTPGGYARDEKHATTGEINEFIHPTTGFRIKMTENSKDENLRYKPAGLEPKSHFIRKKIQGGKGYEYVIAGAAKPLPEWELAPPVYSKGVCFERSVIAGDDATKFVEDLDKELGYVIPSY